MKIITEVNKIADIPSLLFYEENSVNNPLVIIVHGFNNDKAIEWTTKYLV